MTAEAEWLVQRVPGYAWLTGEERDAIMHFTLLWSLFEARALGNHGNARSIIAFVERWAKRGQLDMKIFECPLNYFKQRYVSANGYTDQFETLHFRSGDNRSLVEKVLGAAQVDPVDSASALLIVVYRLRNNLFHGMKWADCLRGQESNFRHANAVLMAALDAQMRFATA